MAADTPPSDPTTYLVWSRTWEAAARQASRRAAEVERRLVRFYRRLCTRLDPTVVLEIGAHEARFSRWAAEAFPAARVLAFEANPHVHAKYADRLAGTRVDYRHLAVGSVNGEIELNLPVEVGGTGRRLTSPLASLRVHTRADKVRQVTVPSVRLEDHVDFAEDDRVVAWIDVEGANEVVLTGAGAVLDRVDALFVEVENTTTWEEQWLDTDVASYLRPRGFVPVARDILGGRPHQYNVVFVRDEVALDGTTTRQAARVLRARKDDPAPG